MQRIRDVFLMGLHEHFNWLDPFSSSQGYVFKVNTIGGFILNTKQVFDPGGIHSLISGVPMMKMLLI